MDLRIASMLVPWLLFSAALAASSQDTCNIVPASTGSSVSGSFAGSADVLILGAGASGIFAAKRLAEAGVNVLILEGYSQIGGRVRSIEVAGQMVEKGANWVQGLDGNPWWDLVQQYNITGAESDWDSLTLYTSDGEAEDADVRWDDMEATVARMESLSQCMAASNESDVNARVGMNLAGWRSQNKIDEALVWFYHDFEFGGPPQETSLKSAYPNPTYTSFRDADYLITDPRGSSYVFEQELQSAGLQSSLRLNSVVKKVHYAGDNVAVEVNESGTMKYYTADHAIMTFSIGVLEHDLVDFEPPLPAWKRKEIHRFDMTKYLKLYIAFNESVWPSTLEHTIYADPARGFYGYWLNLNLAKWGYQPDEAPYILTTHITGFEAERVLRQSRNATIQEIRQVLSEMLSVSVPEPIDFVVCDWANDPLFMGMYSNWPVGVTAADLEMLRKPVDRLWFAGEGYIEGYNGYVHGAILSGNATANRLLACRGVHGSNCSYPLLTENTQPASATFTTSTMTNTTTATTTMTMTTTTMTVTMTATLTTTMTTVMSTTFLTVSSGGRAQPGMFCVCLSLLVLATGSHRHLRL